MTLLTSSDDDYCPEQSGLTRIGADGLVRHRVAETQILVGGPSQLALDRFGNAYITGYGVRAATGLDVGTAKYDSSGHRAWLVYHGAPSLNWEYGVSLGADAAGEIRVLASGGILADSSVERIVLHYRQRDPASAFRLQMVRDAGGTFHLSTPTAEPYRLETSPDLREWAALNAEETQQLLQPGGASFLPAPQRFYRLISTD